MPELLPTLVHENVLSLAMVEAAVRSAATGERVLLDDVLDDAHAEALRAETRWRAGRRCGRC